jgi:hypothetical protein
MNSMGWSINVSTVAFNVDVFPALTSFFIIVVRLYGTILGWRGRTGSQQAQIFIERLSTNEISMSNPLKLYFLCYPPTALHL